MFRGLDAAGSDPTQAALRIWDMSRSASTSAAPGVGHQPDGTQAGQDPRPAPAPAWQDGLLLAEIVFTPAYDLSVAVIR